ncbi:MAG TPA: hypothetical protein VFA53_04770 [Xanthobacteraceae bacterium]|nr:hypothetical protein [Xanthobacteraceae bacterium]
MTSRMHFRLLLPAAMSLGLALAPAAVFAQGMSNDTMSKPAAETMSKPDNMGKTDTMGKGTTGKANKTKSDTMQKQDSMSKDSMAPSNMAK